MRGDIKRPAYSPFEVSDVAEAANLIAAEARAAGCSVQRPFNDCALEGRPTWTAAHSVMWWHVDQERARDRAHDAERDALRARAEAAEADLDALARTVGAAIVAGSLAPGESLTSPPQHAIVSTVNRLRTRAEAAEQRTEAAEAALARARADRALMTGLWLATVPPDVLPTLLPADPGDWDRLAAALDAVDLQASAGSHTAAGRAVIARIVAAAGGAR